MITAAEWYREFAKTGQAGLTRDYEADAEAAEAVEEKIYE